VSKEDRDSLEFDLNDFNICISGMEYDYDCRCIDLEKKKDEEYQKVKDSIKTEATLKRHLESMFLSSQLFLNKAKAQLKRYKALYKGFSKSAEHIKSNSIEEMASKKRM
jgi:hypothetical protein